MVYGGDLRGDRGVDLNDIITTGLYKYFVGPANNPRGNAAAYGILLVLNPGNQLADTKDTYVVQFAFETLSITQFTTMGGVFIRTSINGGSTWSDWNKFSLGSVAN